MIADGLDAAVRFGEPEVSSVVARKLLETRVVTCASRKYLDAHGTPKEPRDLENHECIMFRNPLTGRPYRWQFIRGAKRVTVKTNGRLFVNDSSAQIAACIAGQGVAQTLELALRSIPNHGLELLFANWPDQTFPLYVYYPSRHQPPAKVRALIDFVVAAAR
jgi:DNA-binding transcriptional LysR family regulator